MISFIRINHVYGFQINKMAQSFKDLYLGDYNLEHGIEFVGLITKNGCLVDSQDKNGLNLSREQKEMFFMSCSLQQKMHQDYNDIFGLVRYTVIERENNRIITIPQESGTLIFVMDKNGEFLSRVRTLMDAIQHAKNLESSINPVVT